MKTISNEKILEKFDSWEKKLASLDIEHMMSRGIKKMACVHGFHGGYTTAMADVQALIDRIKRCCIGNIGCDITANRILDVIEKWEDM